ncbi:MAG: tetratricopeptide repeat protein [Xanthomonadales bacterium]
MSGIFSHIITVGTLSFTLLALPGNTVLAQASECSKKRQIGAHALDEFTWNQLNRVYEDVGEQHYVKAYEQLQKMLARAGKGNYLRSVLNQALAQVEWSRENYDPALKYFEKAVEFDALPDPAHFALMYQIAQLYFMQERYREALDKLELWFCQSPGDKITSSAWVLQASIYVQQENYAETLKAIDHAIGMDDDPREQWFQLKLASHYELEQYSRSAQTLEIMITRWPKEKTYWTQLSQIYFELKQDEKALAVMALAYRNALLDTQGDITYLSNLYSNSDVPFKAALVLEKGIKDGVVAPTRNHWTSVADSWYAAQELENSLLAYENAGKVSADGAIDLRRGYILIDLERWPDALQALNDAISKGGLTERKTGEAYLLRGMTQFNLENFDGASADWGKAGSYDRTRDAARQWMNHLREERQRKAP